MKKLLILFLVCFLSSHLLFSEGTKEFRPNGAPYGSLFLTYDNFYTPFGLYGADEEYQIKISVTDTTENIFVGLNSNSNNVPFRVLDPSGNIVYTSNIPENGDLGYISTYNEAAAGPIQLGAINGYDAINIEPKDSGEYVIEFSPPTGGGGGGGGLFTLDYFDVTVGDSLNNPILGRLHSKSWQFSTGSYNNPYEGIFYPYEPKGVVYEVDMNGIQPFAFTVMFNSTGTGNTGDFLEDRKSRIGKHDIPEFNVFLNPPDSSLFPAPEKDITFTAEIKGEACKETQLCLTFNASDGGIIEGFLDFNNNGEYDETLGDLSFAAIVDSAGETCIPWDGIDANGNQVDKRKVQLISSFGSGITHLPLYDIEHNTKGYKISIVKPGNLPDPEIFWDDSEITDGSTNGTPKVNTEDGCQSTTTGCHLWSNRGDINSVNRAQKQETINTYWFAEIKYDTIAFSYVPNVGVNISYDPDNLINYDTLVCTGDTINYFVFNNGLNHFDTTTYNYYWYNASELNVVKDSNVNNFDYIAYQNETIVLEAVYKENNQCKYYDSINVSTIGPIKASLILKDTNCVENIGKAYLEVLTAHPNPEFEWDFNPSYSKNFHENLTSGNYTVTIKDYSFSDQCRFDTSFSIKENILIEIDSINKQATLCYASNGEAEVFMKKPNRIYEYSWNASAYLENESSIDQLKADDYSVSIKDKITGCIADTVINIPPKPFVLPVNKEDEFCNNTEGKIVLNSPSSALTIEWNDITSPSPTRENLSAGSYSVRVYSNLTAGCEVDTTIVIENKSKKPVINSILTTPSNCIKSTGTASVTLFGGNSNYLIAWDSKTNLSAEFTKPELAVGEYKIHIKDKNSDCFIDSTLKIIGAGFSFKTNSEKAICTTPNGSIFINNEGNPNISITWDDNGNHNFSRNNLYAGRYPFSLSNASDPTCNLDTAVYVGKSFTDITADFSYSTPNGTEDIYPTERVIFENQSTKGVSYHYWEFGDGENSNLYEPEHRYNDRGQYNVILTIEDEFGCRDSVSKPLEVIDEKICGIALPNAFTPNYDGINDDIGILGFADKVDLKVFNRWGEVIFRTEEIPLRWDGNNRSQPAPTGVYPYKLEYTCIDLEGNRSKKKEIGEITLIR